MSTGHLSDMPVPDDEDDEKMGRMYRAFGDSPLPPPVPRRSPSSLPPPDSDDPTPLERPPLTILFLGASPGELPDIAPEEEAREIELALAQGARTSRRPIQLVEKVGTHVEDLQRHLHEVLPQVLHVSAHGSVDGMFYLKSNDGKATPVELRVLAAALRALPTSPQVVVLCACFSALGAADELLASAGCVVGMKLEIGVEPAKAFCRAFYTALALGESVRSAFEQGTVEMKVDPKGHETDPRVPQLLGGTADPGNLYLFRRGTRPGPA